MIPAAATRTEAMPTLTNICTSDRSKIDSSVSFVEVEQVAGDRGWGGEDKVMVNLSVLSSVDPLSSSKL